MEEKGGLGVGAETAPCISKSIHSIVIKLTWDVKHSKSY